MTPYHWESHHGNFGDDLNLWLWDFLLPGFRDVHPQTLLVGVGTVLNASLLPRGAHKLVVGSGYGYGVAPDVGDSQEWDLRCVRGPKTAERLGLPPDKAIVDPAVMLAEMPEFQNLSKRHGKTFVPHWESAEFGIWQPVCHQAGLTFLDPRHEAKAVIRHIAQSELVIAESMHGAIIADAFRVPWIAVSTSPSINHFKWDDWASSLGTTYRPHLLPVSSRAEASKKRVSFWGIKPNAHDLKPMVTDFAAEKEGLAHPTPSGNFLRSKVKMLLAAPSVAGLSRAARQEPQLSCDGSLDRLKDRFREVLEAIRKDYL
ncbi:polysaccharide pyruvyl transferase family protein [Mesorhizobium sp. USDA-HM6]|nr:polysaccharide pyruvyl transferase family protein [Mesorhizobium sp. USDA-HM6]